MSRSAPLFVALMLLCGLSAFAFPARVTTAARGPFQNLYWPVARPTRAIAAAVDRHFWPAAAVDDGAGGGRARSAEAVVAENHELRGQLAALSVKFDQLSRLNADRGLVGDIRSLCRPATVSGGDASGVRDVLAITGVDGSAAGRPAVHGSDLVGRVQAAGLTGAALQLVTDPGLAMTVQLKRYQPGPDGRLALVAVGAVHPSVRGTGQGAMAIRSQLTTAAVAQLHLAVGDLVVLDDPAWPANVQGFTVGKVAAIRPQPAAPLFADVRVEPALNLSQLGEVMVVVRN